MGDATIAFSGRDPADPEPVADSKATAAFGLGLLAVVTGLALGGMVPGTIALALARQARAELREGQGWRTGAGRVRWAERLAWTGIVLAAVSALALTVLLVLRGVRFGRQDYPPTVD
ncbi:hypothetical protein Cs7R123_35140 [Catellatospora sp. TT07R-123]|uniref:hypothetical protein n=1 Tax=Catellatospora sp. TT07R-123 TaxID=2733863 RepID=UPI001B1D6A5E|nr:hypothetical protein [Catellatospora sp. TT07R-123]GHJ46172.1 hypothetical protein Cs7R123_35140 [Catellatospora sp. TT07R-123]